MEKDLALGSTVWIEHRDDGDVYFKVKLILEKQPAAVEFCKACHRGQLALMGHLVQTGILDDKVCAVCHCEHCCAVTVFIYHVEAHTRLLPQEADCDSQDAAAGSEGNAPLD